MGCRSDLHMQRSVSTLETNSFNGQDQQFQRLKLTVSMIETSGFDRWNL